MITYCTYKYLQNYKEIQQTTLFIVTNNGNTTVHLRTHLEIHKLQIRRKKSYIHHTRSPLFYMQQSDWRHNLHATTTSTWNHQEAHNICTHQRKPKHIHTSTEQAPPSTNTLQALKAYISIPYLFIYLFHNHNRYT